MGKWTRCIQAQRRCHVIQTWVPFYPLPLEKVGSVRYPDRTRRAAHKAPWPARSHQAHAHALIECGHMHRGSFALIIMTRESSTGVDVPAPIGDLWGGHDFAPCPTNQPRPIVSSITLGLMQPLLQDRQRFKRLQVDHTSAGTISIRYA